MRRALTPLLLAGLALSPGCADDPDTALWVGSKKFTESVILGELGAQLLRSAGVPAGHRSELGGTRVLWSALRRGEIDAYADYTGTIAQEILSGRLGDRPDFSSLQQALAAEGVRLGGSLGFENSYALGMRAERAERLGIDRISQLRDHPALRFGFTNEFMDRRDGWPGLRERYGLPQRDVRGLDHDLAYRGIESGTLDVTDLYSTDADILYYRLHVLEDDLDYFPRYEAVWLWRADLGDRVPQAVATLRRLEGALDARRMIALNGRAKLEGISESRVASDFLSETFGIRSSSRPDGVAAVLAQRTAEHLVLVAISLGAAVVLALPLGIAAARRRRLGQTILAVVGVIQTIPSLALLVFMIPLLGIGSPPAIAALFLYSLLPIVRNTYAGLHDIPQPLRETAEALGLTPGARLFRVELPLAMRTILAGIKTAAVINVGTATLGALIGAGGYGQPILTGIRLDDVGLILQGALPAAALALGVQGAFEGLERAVVPRGLRVSRRG